MLNISMKIAKIHRTHNYVNTAIAYLVILTSGSDVDFYPRCNSPNGPVRVCRMMALSNAKLEN